MSRGSVLVVEDDPWIRAAVTEALTGAGLTVTAVGTVREAVAHARTRAPAAAIVDLGLPDGSGVEVIATLRQVAPRCAAIAFTVFDDAERVLGALAAGARGYLLKAASPDDLVRALDDAQAGGIHLSPGVARLLCDRWIGTPDSRSGAALTDRETEVLRHLALGATYAACADALGIGLGTVQGHVKSIYGKLEVTSKAEAALAAARLGLLR
jgi:DNA-binding NarL/FixJ family response regulator